MNRKERLGGGVGANPRWFEALIVIRPSFVRSGARVFSYKLVFVGKRVASGAFADWKIRAPWL